MPAHSAARSSATWPSRLPSASPSVVDDSRRDRDENEADRQRDADVQDREADPERVEADREGSQEQTPAARQIEATFLAFTHRLVDHVDAHAHQRGETEISRRIAQQLAGDLPDQNAEHRHRHLGNRERDADADLDAAVRSAHADADGHGEDVEPERKRDEEYLEELRDRHGRGALRRLGML